MPGYEQQRDFDAESGADEELRERVSDPSATPRPVHALSVTAAEVAEILELERRELERALAERREDAYRAEQCTEPWTGREEE